MNNLHVSPPPLDYDCILNEPIWFNRFLYLPSDPKHGRPDGRLLKKDIENNLIERGFTHLLHLLAFMPPANPTGSPWLTTEDAIFNTGSKKLGAALISIIDLIPVEWSRIVRLKICESFLPNEWVVKRSDSVGIPHHVFHVIQVLPSKLFCRRYHVRRTGSPHVFQTIPGEEHISKAYAIKACVLFENANKDASPAYYCGNYLSSKLLLSRLNWGDGNHFFTFGVNMAYQGIISHQMKPISAILKWETVLNMPLAHMWVKMIAYLHDFMLNNRTKEKLYKIYTRSLPAGSRMKGANAITNCPHCGNYENEMHCFVQCAKVQPLWQYVKQLLNNFLPWVTGVTGLSDAQLLFGYVENHASDKYIRIWKVFHAESIRVIWYSRCRKFHDNEDTHIQALKSTVRHREKAAFSIYEASNAEERGSQIQVWNAAFPASTIKNGRTNLNIVLD
jgi:hypothetical protein